MKEIIESAFVAFVAQQVSANYSRNRTDGQMKNEMKATRECNESNKRVP
jgi:hypothetical protein